MQVVTSATAFLVGKDAGWVFWHWRCMHLVYPPCNSDHKTMITWVGGPYWAWLSTVTHGGGYKKCNYVLYHVLSCGLIVDGWDAMVAQLKWCFALLNHWELRLFFQMLSFHIDNKRLQNVLGISRCEHHSIAARLLPGICVCESLAVTYFQGSFLTKRPVHHWCISDFLNCVASHGTDSSAVAEKEQATVQCSGTHVPWYCISMFFRSFRCHHPWATTWIHKMIAPYQATHPKHTVHCK